MPESPLHAPLLSWYAAAARDLPWRAADRDPWGVLVSEVMLQQTPVDRVVPAWDAWMSRWPTPAALAADSAGEAVRMWGRLGYPRRALRLHAAAVACVERFEGRVPSTYDDLRSLPGIGDYTAAAVLAFAYGRRAVVLDTNVRRVLARLLDGAEHPRPSVTAAERELAGSVLPDDDATAAGWSIALMELGALVCLPRAPRCEECPFAGSCLGRASGRPEAFPSPRARKAGVSIRLAAGLARRGERLVLVEDAILVRGHLVLPLVEVPDGADAGELLRAAWPRLAGRRARRLVPAGLVRHAVLERRYAVELYLVAEGARARAGGGVRALLPAQLETEPRGGLLPKLLALSARSALPASPAPARRGPARPRRTGG